MRHTHCLRIDSLVGVLGRAALAEAQDAARDGATNAAASETEALLHDNGLLHAALAALQGQLQDAQPAGALCLLRSRSKTPHQAVLHPGCAKAEGFTCVQAINSGIAGRA